MNLEPGMQDTRGRFTIDEQFTDRGSTGEVYRAHDQAGNDVIIKTLKEEYQAFDQYKRRLLREIDIQGKLQHPNIAGSHGIAVFDNETIALAMEYAGDDELYRLCKRRRFFSDESAASVISHIALALDHAHTNGVVHRDVAAENVIIRQANGVIIPKVIDWGYARVIGEDDGVLAEGFEDTYIGPRKGWGGRELTKKMFGRYNMFGRFRYVPPEVIMGRRADGRADLYSLGVILYNQITGRFPFGEKYKRSMIKGHLHDDPTPPNNIRPERKGRTKLEKVCLRMLAKKREERYHSGKEVAAAIADAMGWSSFHYNPDAANIDSVDLFGDYGLLETGGFNAGSQSQKDEPDQQREFSPIQNRVFG